VRKFLTGPAVVVLIVAMVATGCGKSKKSSSTATTAGAKGAQTFNVQLDGKSASYNGAFTAFFPNTFSAHPGDTVDFSVPRVNEPHTVALGTLVDAGVNKIAALGPTASFAAQENSPELLKLPDVFPHTVPKGPPDANQSAAQPCFLASGVPPLSLSGSAPACPKVAQPDFDGTQAFYNSGALWNDGDSFKVKLSPNIKPGTYQLMCMIHRGGMTATLTVAPSSQTIPTPADVTATGKKQFDALDASLKPVADGANTANGTTVHGGLGDPKVFNALVAQWGPKDVSVPVGGTVTWDMFLFHSLSFGYTPADVGAFVKAADGSIHLSPKAGAPAGVQVPDAAFTFPPADTDKPFTIDAGSWDGTGTKSTGIIGSVPPALITVKLKFTKAGTYTYECLFHRDMTGTVKVG
jgi:plastocyanin